MLRRPALALALLALLSAASPATAAISESEGNGSLATANALTLAGGGRLVAAALTPGDVDFYAFPVNAGDFVTLSVIEGGNGAFHDARMKVYDALNAEVTQDDDSGPGFLPALRLRVPSGGGGTWKVAVTGFEDKDFDGGDHGEDFPYQLVISAEPPAFDEPSPDSNGTQANADTLGSGDFETTAPGSVAVIAASLGNGDVDHFSFPVTTGRRLSVAIYDEDGGAFNDPVVSLLAANASELAQDDDSGPGFLPALSREASANATWTVRVGPFKQDLDAHDYRLVVALAPSDETAFDLVCDANNDDFVDSRDIDLIFAARGTPASGPGDPRDPNADGRITIQDGQLCKLQCTNAHCAAPMVNGTSCGLLGIEPVAVLALLAWRRRSRHRNRLEERS